MPSFGVGVKRSKVTHGWKILISHSDGEVHIKTIVSEPVNMHTDNIIL